MTRQRFAAILGLAALALTGSAGCRGTGAIGPAALDTRHDACAHCRMSVSTQIFAAQVVAPGEEPKFFDDIGCLSAWLRAGASIPAGGRAFVADHRTRAWVPAAAAVYTRVPGLETPMGSGLIAHESTVSRDQDPVARGGGRVALAEVLTGAPGAER